MKRFKEIVELLGPEELVALALFLGTVYLYCILFRMLLFPTAS